MELINLIKKIFEGKFEVLTKEVKKFGSSGTIYLPKKYIGKKIVVILENDTESAGATADAVENR